MSYRYIALLGPCSREARDALESDPALRILLDRPGLLVGCAPDTPWVDMPGYDGVIIGTLFDHRGKPVIEYCENRRVQLHDEDGGKQLLERYWGSYVALFVGPDGACCLRDPSGAMPCYFARSDRCWVITSDVRACISLGLMPLAIDWPAVCSHLLWPERRTGRTCLTGIRELLPGCSQTIDDRSARIEARSLPWYFTSADRQIDDAAEAAIAVGTAVDLVGTAWCSRFSSPLVSLSGGLDSSIVLASAPCATNVVTFITHEAMGDERAYAQAMADYRDVDLRTRELDPASIDVGRSHAADLPRPVARLFAQELDRNWRDAGAQTGADALFHGGGGDNVFCYLASAAPYVDSLIARRSRDDLRDIASSLSKMTRVSLWRIRRAALRKLLVDRGQYRWPRNAAMLTASAILNGEPVETHPWFCEVPVGTLPGKRAHVASLIRIQNHLDAIDANQVVPAIAPLMSQPVMEACLRIPSWLWCRDGLNRVVARDAFRERLPARIVQRHLKGSPAAFDARVVAGKREEISSFLRDGHLAARDLICMRDVDRALGESGPLIGQDYSRVTEFVDVEAWLQSWIGAPSDRGSAHS